MKNSYSKGGVRDRSNDTVRSRKRDPSIKFPETRGVNKLDKSTKSTRQLNSKATYQPSSHIIRDSSGVKYKAMNKIGSVKFTNSLKDYSTNKDSRIQSSQKSLSMYKSRRGDSSCSSSRLFESSKNSMKNNYSSTRSGNYVAKENKNVVPILPRKATPSNSRYQSVNEREMISSAQNKFEINPLPISSKYLSLRDKTPPNDCDRAQNSAGGETSRHTTKSVDHVRDYIQKK